MQGHAMLLALPRTGKQALSLLASKGETVCGRLSKPASMKGDAFRPFW